MATPSLTPPLRVASFIVALALSAAPAFAQGTSAEREACTEDAVNLCSDTIPDVPKTTVCMKAHLSQLSPRCRAVVAGRPDEPARPARTRRIERAAREAPPPERDDVPTVGRQAPQDDYEEMSERRYVVPPADADDPGDPGERRYLYADPYGQPIESPPPSDGSRERARARIERLCDEDRIDPKTCALTDRALR